VIHGDVEPRHWLRHPVDGSIRIIDFDMARVVGAERAGGSGGRGENGNEIDNEGEGLAWDQDVILTRLDST